MAIIGSVKFHRKMFCWEHKVDRQEKSAGHSVLPAIAMFQPFPGAISKDVENKSSLDPLQLYTPEVRRPDHEGVFQTGSFINDSCNVY